MSLDSKVAVVTGAAGGIGRAASIELARAGASLLLVGAHEDGLQQTARAVGEAGGRARLHVADVSRSDDVRAYVAAAVEAYGRIDVLFNNAGIEGPLGPTVDYPDEEFDRVIAVNVRGVFLGLKHVLPGMIAQGSGSIVNNASTAGHAGFSLLCAYTASKHAVIGLTKVAAAEAGPAGVRVNAVSPGPIETRMMRAIERGRNPGDPEAVKRRVMERVPLGRYGDAAEIARVVRFLASDDASYVNGAVWLIDGGRLAAP